MLLGDLYKEQLKKNAGKAALIFKGTSTSYAEFDEAVSLTADALLSLGINRGDRVALFMRNRTELLEFYFGCFRIGAVAVPLNHRYMQDEVVYAVNHSSASILIADDELYEIVEDIHSRVPTVRRVFSVGYGSGDGEHSWENVAAEALRGLEIPEVKGEDPAMVMYTSGSTQKPKGVTYTHAALLNFCMSRKITMRLTEDEVGLAATAICHCGGSVGMAFPTLYIGGTVIIMETPDPQLFLECVEKYRPNRTLILPAQLLDVLDAPKARDTDFSCFSDVLTGGDYISLDLYERFHDITGLELNQLYGMTECEGMCFTPPSLPIKYGSVGRPRHGVKIRLVDEAGKDVNTGEPGAILVKSDTMTIGYWNDEKNTSLAFTQDGWLKTGDEGRQDEDGYYYFVGRIKEIIVKRGSNVAPGEVEEVLDDHPQISISGVVGSPDKRHGELIHAFVELKPGLKDPPGEDELRAYTSKKLAAYKVPDRWTIVETLPRNEIGKIDRRGLHALAKKLDAE